MIKIIDKIIKICNVAIYFIILMISYILVTSTNLQTKILCIAFIMCFLLMVIHNLLIIRTSELEDLSKEIKELLKK